MEEEEPPVKKTKPRKTKTSTKTKSPSKTKASTDSPHSTVRTTFEELLAASTHLTPEQREEIQRKAENDRKVHMAEKYRKESLEIQKTWKKVWTNKGIIQNELRAKFKNLGEGKIKGVGRKIKKNTACRNLLTYLTPEWKNVRGERTELHRKMKNASLKPLSSPFQKKGQGEIIQQQREERMEIREETAPAEEVDEEREEDGEEVEKERDMAPPPKRRRRSRKFIIESDSSDDDNGYEQIVIKTSELRQMIRDSERFKAVVKIVTGTDAVVRTPQKNVKKGETVCNHCEINFYTTKALRRHLKVVNKKTTAKYRCEEEGCTDKFINNFDLKEHVKWHKDSVNKSQGELWCACCERLFRSKRAFVKHKETKESRRREEEEGVPRKYQCRFCEKGGEKGKGFHRRDACTEHERGCVDNENRQSWNCRFCDHEVFRFKDLGKHEGFCSDNPNPKKRKKAVEAKGDSPGADK